MLRTAQSQSGDPQRDGIRRVYSHSAVLLIIAAFFLSRLAYFYHAKLYSPSSREFSYRCEMELAAIHLAAEGVIGDVFGPDTGVSAHLAPVYPAFLAVLYRLSGADMGWFRWSEGLAAILASTLGIALLPALAARARLGRGAGEGAALLMLCAPFGFSYEIRGDWEAPFVPLAMAAAFWALMALRDRSWSDYRVAAVSGAIIGVGALLNPIILLGALLALSGEFVSRRGRQERMQVALCGAILLGTAALAIAPWTYRNYVRLSAFVPIRSNFGLEFAVGNDPRNLDGTTFSVHPAHPTNDPAERERLRALGEIEYNRMRLREATGWVRENPGVFLEKSWRRLVLFWFPHGNGVWGRPTLVPVALKTATLAATTLMALGGLALAFAGRHPYRFLFAGLLLGPSIPYAITHVFFRYRYPLLWLTFLLAGECLSRCFHAARAHAAAREVGTGAWPVAADRSISSG